MINFKSRNSHFNKQSSNIGEELTVFNEQSNETQESKYSLSIILLNRGWSDKTIDEIKTYCTDELVRINTVIAHAADKDEILKNPKIAMEDTHHINELCNLFKNCSANLWRPYSINDEAKKYINALRTMLDAIDSTVFYNLPKGNKEHLESSIFTKLCTQVKQRLESTTFFSNKPNEEVKIHIENEKLNIALDQSHTVEIPLKESDAPEAKETALKLLLISEKYNTEVTERILECYHMLEIKRLDLSNLGLTEVPSNKILSYLSRVKDINLKRNKISEINSAAFAGLTELTTLHLNGNEIGEIKPQAFAGLTNLIYLNLHNNKLSEIKPQAFAGLTTLENLELGENKISEIKPMAFAGLKKLINISLYNNKITSFPDGIFRDQICLERITCQGNPIKTIPAKDIMNELLYEISEPKVKFRSYTDNNIIEDYSLINITDTYIYMNTSALIRDYLETYRSGDAENFTLFIDLSNKYWLQRLENDCLPLKHPISPCLIKQIYEGKLAVAPGKELSWYCKLFAEHNLNSLPFLNKRENLTYDNLKSLDSYQLVTPPSTPQIELRMQHELENYLREISPDINLKEEIDAFKNGVINEVIDDELDTIDTTITEKLREHGLEANPSQKETVIDAIKSTDNNRPDNIRRTLNEIIPENLTDKEQLLDILSTYFEAFNKVDLQKFYLADKYRLWGLTPSQDDIDNLYNKIAPFFTWEKTLNSMIDDVLKKMSTLVFADINGFKDPKVYSMLISNYSLYLNGEDINHIIKEGKVTKECQTKLESIKYYHEEVLYHEKEDYCKMIAINEDHAQALLLINDLTALNPETKDINLRKIQLIKDNMSYAITANNLNGINLPRYLEEIIKKQFTVSNTVAGKVDEMMTDIIKKEQYDLDADTREKLTEACYEAAQSLGTQIHVASEFKKKLRAKFKDEQLINGATENSDGTITPAGKLNTIMLYLSDVLDKTNGNEDDKLNQLAPALIAKAKELQLCGYITQLGNGLHREFTKQYQSLETINKHEIYYLLGVYFMNLCSVRGLGSYNDNTKNGVIENNRSFNLLRLFAAIALALSLSQITRYTTPEKIKSIAHAIKEALLETQCAGVIVDALYGKQCVEPLQNMTLKIEEILNTKK